MIRFAKLYDDALLPKQALEGSIGLDVHAYIKRADGEGNLTLPSKQQLPPQMVRAVRTGIVALASPPNYIQVCSRSGLAGQHVFVANAPGIVDPDYTGEIVVLLYNGGLSTCWIEDGQRIAQLVLTTAIIVRPEDVDVIDISEVPDTQRGDKGFGSTGR